MQCTCREKKPFTCNRMEHHIYTYIDICMYIFYSAENSHILVSTMYIGAIYIYVIHDIYTCSCNWLSFHNSNKQNRLRQRCLPNFTLQETYQIFIHYIPVILFLYFHLFFSFNKLTFIKVTHQKLTPMYHDQQRHVQQGGASKSKLINSLNKRLNIKEMLTFYGKTEEKKCSQFLTIILSIVCKWTCIHAYIYIYIYHVPWTCSFKICQTTISGSTFMLGRH
jgi:hypothetical protein